MHTYSTCTAYVQYMNDVYDSLTSMKTAREHSAVSMKVL